MCYICGRGLGACKCSWGLPSLLWTIICPHFRILGLDFLVFSRLRFQDFGANETHPIHTHKPTIFIFHKGCPLRAGGDARSVRNLLSKTDDFITMINSLNKTDDFIKMINSLSKTDDFVKNDKFLTLRASPPARRGQPLWKMNMVGSCVCMG